MDIVKEQDKINFVFLEEQEEKILVSPRNRNSTILLPFSYFIFHLCESKTLPRKESKKKIYVNKKRQKSVRKMKKEFKWGILEKLNIKLNK